MAGVDAGEVDNKIWFGVSIIRDKVRVKKEYINRGVGVMSD